MSATPFVTLFVCTGNICRSPMAERLYAMQNPDVRLTTVSSAGVIARPGMAMDRPSASALSRLGGDPVNFAATRLEAELLQDADLILGLAAEHRSAILRLSPRTMNRAFTLAEFCRLSANVQFGDGSASDARRVVREAARQRGLTDAIPAADEDVPDPLSAPDSVVRACSLQIQDLVQRLTSSLGFDRALNPPAA